MLSNFHNQDVIVQKQLGCILTLQTHGRIQKMYKLTVFWDNLWLLKKEKPMLFNLRYNSLQFCEQLGYILILKTQGRIPNDVHI
jgi:hypothetical protein